MASQVTARKPSYLAPTGRARRWCVSSVEGLLGESLKWWQRHNAGVASFPTSSNAVVDLSEELVTLPGFTVLLLGGHLVAVASRSGWQSTLSDGLLPVQAPQMSKRQVERRPGRSDAGEGLAGRLHGSSAAESCYSSNCYTTHVRAPQWPLSLTHSLTCLTLYEPMRAQSMRTTPHVH